MSAKSICFVAGEPSGDLQGSLLVAELTRRHPDWELWGVGSERMASAGLQLWRDARDWAVMGFAEVVRSIWIFRKRLRALVGEVKHRRPNAIILIDYPGFNLRLAPHLHRAGIPVYYYIVPQLWAWGKGRIKVFRQSVDRTVVVFPFEKEYFRNRGVDAEWIGHPLIDVVKPSDDREALRRKFGVTSEQKLIALLPGARSQDYQAHLPVFLEATRTIQEVIPGTQGVIGINPAVGSAETLTDGDGSPLPTTSDVYDLIAAADVALTKTGTATVETAILGTPMVAAYRTGTVNYAIARSLVDIPFIAMPNLIANRRIVPEFVQSQATPGALAREALILLQDHSARSDQCAGLAEVRERLGPPGAVKRAADLIDTWLENRT
jgi:lipid-A-disaccharide synthase